MFMDDKVNITKVHYKNIQGNGGERIEILVNNESKICFDKIADDISNGTFVGSLSDVQKIHRLLEEVYIMGKNNIKVNFNTQMLFLNENVILK